MVFSKVLQSDHNEAYGVLTDSASLRTWMNPKTIRAVPR